MNKLSTCKILDLACEVKVVLGKKKCRTSDVAVWGEGSIIELEKLAGEPVEIEVNGTVAASGEVVVIDESFGVRITEMRLHEKIAETASEK